jgi:hypothetical protein
MNQRAFNVEFAEEELSLLHFLAQLLKHAPQASHSVLTLLASALVLVPAY